MKYQWAMQANRLHGKRMTEADHKRAIEIAIDHELLRSVHAKDVVPEIVELVGCSVRTAQVNTVGHRRAMIEKRDRLILAMSREGRSQEAIGASLEVPQQTVADVIKRATGKRTAALSGKPQRPAPPIVEWPKATDIADDAPETVAMPASVPQPPKASAPPAFKIDLGQFLPLLDRLRPLDEQYAFFAYCPVLVVRWCVAAGSSCKICTPSRAARAIAHGTGAAYILTTLAPCACIPGAGFRCPGVL